MAAAGAWAVLLALAVSVGSCKGDEGGETPQQRAKREIIESLFVPPNSQLQETKIMVATDMLTLRYGTNETLETLEQFFKEQARQKKYATVSETASGISYQDDKRRHITVMWFARDPDLSEFKTIFRIAV